MLVVVSGAAIQEYWSESILVFVRNATIMSFGVSSQSGQIEIGWNGNNVRWWSKNNSAYQNNVTNSTNYYIAIGHS